MRPLARALSAALTALLLVLNAGCGHQDYATLSVTAHPLTRADLAGRLQQAQRGVTSYQYTLDTEVGQHQLGGFGEVRQRAGRVVAAHGSVDLPGGRGAIESIQLGHTYFLKGLPTSRPWLRIDRHSTGPVARQFLAIVRAGNDPTAAYRAFASASDVTLSGRGPVGGVDTTHYRVTVPRSAFTAIQRQPGLASQLPARLTYDLFVDRHDLVRKLVLGYRIAGRDTTFTATFTDYGKPVRIRAPSPGVVTRALPTAAQLTGGSTAS
jgi:hypothetical protein